MTEPTPTFVTGPTNPDPASEPASVRKSFIASLVVAGYTPPIHDADGNTIGWADARYVVMAQAPTGTSVGVAEFATHQEAIDYVQDDPDGLLS